MRIGFDVSQTGAGKAGCGYFAHAMLQAMLDVAPEHRYRLFPSFGDFYFDPLMPIQNPYRSAATTYGPRHLTRESAQRFWCSNEAATVLDQLDVVHANNFWCPTDPTSSRLIYTFYDMGFAIDPSWTTEKNRRGCFDGVFRSAVAADWILAISEASRSHYLRVFPSFPEERVRVIHPCSRFDDPQVPGTRPQAIADLPPGGFWLNVGTVEPRKNQRMLIDAYARYRRASRAPMPLVLAGGKGWLMEDFRHHLRDLGLDPFVVMTGYVTDAELIWLYRNCHANLYPSHFEGFGLPVLEGMQFGAPTVAANNTSIPEVAGDAAILLDADDVDGWTRTMIELESNEDQRERMSRQALVRASQFEWKQGARHLLDLYKEAAASPKRLSP